MTSTSSMWKIVALLDKPSPNSLGMVPFVVRRADEFRIAGMTRNSEQYGITPSSQEIDLLVDGGHALSVQGWWLLAFDQDDAALWVGDSFEMYADEIGVPAPQPLDEMTVFVQGGRFCVKPSREVFGTLQTWITRAYEAFCDSQDDDRRATIARLMRWALPDHKLTRQASVQCARPQRST